MSPKNTLKKQQLSFSLKYISFMSLLLIEFKSSINKKCYVQKGDRAVAACDTRYMYVPKLLSLFYGVLCCLSCDEFYYGYNAVVTATHFILVTETYIVLRKFNSTITHLDYAASHNMLKLIVFLLQNISLFFFGALVGLYESRQTWHIHH